MVGEVGQRLEGSSGEETLLQRAVGTLGLWGRYEWEGEIRQ